MGGRERDRDRSERPVFLGGRETCLAQKIPFEQAGSDWKRAGPSWGLFSFPACSSLLRQL